MSFFDWIWWYFCHWVSKLEIMAIAPICFGALPYISKIAWVFKSDLLCLLRVTVPANISTLNHAFCSGSPASHMENVYLWNATLHSAACLLLISIISLIPFHSTRIWFWHWGSLLRYFCHRSKRILALDNIYSAIYHRQMARVHGLHAFVMLPFSLRDAVMETFVMTEKANIQILCFNTLCLFAII